MTSGIIDLLSEDVQSSPYEAYGKLREDLPVYFMESGGFYVVSRYEDIREALKQTDVFSNTGFRPQPLPPKAIEILDREGPGMYTDVLIFTDPPSHTRYRQLVGRAFTASRVKALEKYIQTIVDDLLRPVLAAGEMEVMTALAIPLPLTIIAEQIGAPREDIQRLKRWTDADIGLLGMMSDEAQILQFARELAEYGNYFVERIEERRKAPRDDIISVLVGATMEGGKPLSTRELLGVIMQVLAGGNETTTSAIGSGFLLLARDRALQERLAADRSLVPGFVEELLRLESPIQGLFRVALQDTELGGVRIPKGARVHLRYASANRDDSVFEDAARLDPERENSGSHLAFGSGIHHCIGSQLARAELRILFESFLARAERLELLDDPDGLHYHPSVIARALDSLNVRFDTKA